MVDIHEYVISSHVTICSIFMNVSRDVREIEKRHKLSAQQISRQLDQCATCDSIDPLAISQHRSKHFMTNG